MIKYLIAILSLLLTGCGTNYIQENVYVSVHAFNRCKPHCPEDKVAYIQDRLTRKSPSERQHHWAVCICENGSVYDSYKVGKDGILMKVTE